jgi:hypothetical protein
MFGEYESLAAYNPQPRGRREYALAYYKHSKYLIKSDHALFDQIFEPGQTTLYSGIYKCEVCGKEDTCIKDKPLPLENHHQHQPNQGPIRWRMVVGYQPDPNK